MTGVSCQPAAASPSMSDPGSKSSRPQDSVWPAPSIARWSHLTALATHTLRRCVFSLQTFVEAVPPAWISFLPFSFLPEYFNSFSRHYNTGGFLKELFLEEVKCIQPNWLMFSSILWAHFGPAREASSDSAEDRETATSVSPTATSLGLGTAPGIKQGLCEHEKTIDSLIHH